MLFRSEIYARKLGITIDNRIGSGCFANVYSIKESKSWVLKCTSDYDELEIINRLNRCSIPIPGFVTIINPSIINGSPGWGRESRLCYLAEACTGLSERQRHIWSAVWRVTCGVSSLLANVTLENLRLNAPQKAVFDKIGRAHV